MKINGKELSITNDGDGIYYDHKLIMDRRTGLNEYTDWNYWVNRITNDPEFCACKAARRKERCPSFVCAEICPVYSTTQTKEE